MIAIRMTAALISGEISSIWRPIAEAAMIRLNREEIRNPPATARLNPNRRLQINDGSTLTAYKVTRKRPRNRKRELSKLPRIDGSNRAPTIIKNTGIKNPYPIPSSLSSNRERALWVYDERSNPPRNAPSNIASRPKNWDNAMKISRISSAPLTVICETASESWKVRRLIKGIFLIRIPVE